MQIQSKYDVIVIGGGVYGLSIAYYLSKQENIKIALLQQYSIGHTKGSSHSTTRITRSLYEKQLYRNLNLQCLDKNWPQMQKVLKTKLVYNNDFIYFDEDQSSYQRYRKVASQQQQPQTVIICQSAQQYNSYFKHKKHPQINSTYPPIIDKNAGIIYAALYIKKMKQYLQTKCDNVTLLEHTTVKAITENQKELSVETQSDILRANRVVVAGGKWVKDLLPEVSDLFVVVKQFMAFVELQPQRDFVVGKYPSFAHHTKNGKMFYSVPCDTTEKLGVKLAQHRFDQPSNTDSVQNTIDYNYEQLRKKALEYFGQDFIRIKNVEQCFYTNTKTNDFVIDWAGESQRILICSCCSGHGFKFAPIIGEIVSRIALRNEQDDQGVKSSKKIEAYEKWKHMFKIAYHRGINLE